jgi:hypothetical protein
MDMRQKFTDVEQKPTDIDYKDWQCDNHRRQRHDEHNVAKHSTSMSFVAMSNSDVTSTTMQNVPELYNDGKWQHGATK